MTRIELVTKTNQNNKAATLLNILSTEIAGVKENGQDVFVFLMNGGSRVIPRRYWL